MRLGALMTFLNPGLDSTCGDESPSLDAPATRAKVELTAGEWRKRLTPDQFHVLRERGSSRLLRAVPHRENSADGYSCVGCGSDLFARGDALPTPNGSLEFAAPIVDGAIYEALDSRFGLLRVAISCTRCDGHLGYVKLDPTTASGKRYLVEPIATMSRNQN